jgi:hypothetical protein
MKEGKEVFRFKKRLLFFTLLKELVLPTWMERRDS